MLSAFRHLKRTPSNCAHILRAQTNVQFRQHAVASRVGIVSFSRTLATDTFVLSNNSNYIEEMYEAWRQDPKSVHVSWDAYFKNLDSGVAPSAAFSAPPTLIPTPAGGAGVGFDPGAGGHSEDVVTHLKVQLLVRAYQVRGHQKAKIDPLGISFGDQPDLPKELTLEHYGFTERDMDKSITLGPGILPRFVESGKKTMTLREIIDACERLYCSSYGVEYIHIPSKEQCDWLRERIEIPQPFKYSSDEKRQILDRLIWSCSFESFWLLNFLMIRDLDLKEQRQSSSV
ncbi:2-oxoglutarate dehydrogenase, mitochondrial [Candidozyma auris]|nr:2-oxoglutarate dehydrogenase, mitochondrial [[Candida] auris]